MKLAGSKVLVTGAGGFIGSHLVEALVREGSEVRAFVFYNSLSSIGWLADLPDEIKSQLDIVYGDIRDTYATKNALRGCQLVLHLAALVGIPYSYRSPEAYVDTNVKGTLNILQGAQELDIAKVVHTSTSEVYGTARFVPITEQHLLQGQSPYAATKIGADQLALSFFHSFGTPVSVLRPFNTYGPRQSLRAVIPTVIAQLANGATDLKLGSLHPTRDFTFVRDTVRGFMAAASSDSSIGQVVHVGSGYEISIGEVVRIIAELMGVDVEVGMEAERVRPVGSEVERLWADPSKAKEMLGWLPDYTGDEGFRRGLRETIDWFTNPDHLQGYRSQAYRI
ncbi:NAD dependent epimerase/dehydratase, LLPSF_EDH_00030 family [Paenibacillus sp. 1_12]|uniref:NAD-dependent 4,6-dehydratase LegB n=1 Tax=Paenibacillus sp. 1_12 TaxID=1566278 RepID=UPI0008EB7541|nr:NAD-dependent 4,6-dehydratase LegB [Paenibacillus sp. 1_12]SFK81480.1 NAD dependent epimerase/dehydratase, LLPSF_EDH_00030 family [Paenibacillus sp. 1_12]